MIKFIFPILVILVVVAVQGLDQTEEDHKPGSPFEFSYNVDESHSRKEESNGDVVTGEYRVLQDDGRTRVVRYTADWKNGVKVDITYEGEAHLTEEGNLSQGLRPASPTTRRPPPPPRPTDTTTTARRPTQPPPPQKTTNTPAPTYLPPPKPGYNYRRP